jgi:excisionase family DNA binding protein
MPGQGPPVNETLLSVQEAADCLGMSKSFMYQNDIPWVKIGRTRRYRPSDLATYVNAHVSHRQPKGDK